ncbi:acetamidase/formamidase family protein [Bradyrhizobium sp. sBnM-33]|uniref:acetamidase/formamidase family protein n=1 Tax=Bradyrhizobium sp. sBnM-33 TaxID=2831780 RepID=UPI001BCCE0F3|nr:acetamidase/formamidase family protein [Bradyrhizobium sp. sBnM-33]WOH52432.1 acetamidase/formamidase family protein [Bradyrhizobium sp. sBnM-33]
MQRLSKEKAVVIDFGAHLKPQLQVEPGESFVVETLDNFWDLLGDAGSVPDLKHPRIRAQQYPRVNPVAGPVYLNGAEPGDTIVVNLEKIDVRDWGWTGTVQGMGRLTGLSYLADIDVDFSTVISHVPGPSGTLADGTAVMNVGREVRWPLAPFLGTILTAPERGIENTLKSQGPWGGNIDVRDVCAGSRIYMNSAHPGGLLFFGDVHASQGDSELTGNANETAAEVTASMRLLKGRSVPGVIRIEKPHSLIQVDSARNSGSSERAITNCFVNMIRWLVDDFGMSKREAYLHMSANSLVRVNVYQATGTTFVCGVEFPKQCL